jgi:hypothetical protein
VLANAARPIDLAPTHLRLLDTLHLVRDVLPDFQRAASVEQLCRYRQLLADVAVTRLPARTNHGKPRVVKHQTSNFRVKGPQHHDWSRPRTPF